MLVAELIKSCSHAKVAEAAIHSIGQDLLRDLCWRANACGLDVGAYVAKSVQRFALSASPHDWRRLAARLEGVDMPILTGLLYILEQSVAEELGLTSATLELDAFRLPDHERLANGRTSVVC